MRTELEIREEVRKESKVRWAINEIIWALKNNKVPDESMYLLLNAINLLKEALGERPFKSKDELYVP